MTRVELLRQRMMELNDANSSLRAAADADGRDLTVDERITLRENNDTVQDLLEEITELERDDRNQALMRQSTGRRSDPEQPARSNARERTERTERNDRNDRNGQRPQGARGVIDNARSRNEGSAGFETMGQFLMSVRNSTVAPQAMDPRLIIRAETAADFSNTQTGSEGGFALPPDFRNMIMEKVFSENTLIGRTDQMTTSTNQITIPIDESEPWSASGLQVYWEAEGAVKRTSVVNLDQNTVRANKIAGVVPVTDELLEDAPALESYIKRKVPEKIDFKTSLAIIHGSGTGEPLGILNSAARVTVNPGSAPAGSLQSPHIAEMYSRMPAGSRGNAVWLVNPEIEPLLMHMAFMVTPSATLPTSPVPVYMPPTGLSSSPYASLMGRPVIPTQVCNPAGVEGDIMFVDLSQYLTLTKSGGIKTDVSIHVYFLQDLTAFRFVLRIGGQPWWKRPIQPRAGTFTQSPYVTLGDR